MEMCDVEFLAEDMDEESDDIEADMMWEEDEILSARDGLKPEWEPFEVAIIACL